MKTYKKLIISCLAVLAILSFANTTQAVTLNQTSVSVSTLQSVAVYASNIVSYLYVSSNSNPNIATVSVSGNTLNIYGVSTGGTTATICDGTTYNCSALYITVNGNNYNNYNNSTLGVNISNLTLPAGGSATVTSSSYYNTNTGLYVSNNSNPSVASTSSSSLVPGCYGTNVYSITTGQRCNSAYSYNNTSTSYVPGCYGTNQFSITTGQSCYGGINNSNGSASVVITGVSAGSDTITLCQNNSGTCSTLSVVVTGGGFGTAYPYSSPTTYNNSGIPTVYSSSSAN